MPRGADEATIKKAYRRLARRHHPDLNPGDEGAAEAFKRIAKAFETLSDPEQRRAHDAARQRRPGTLPEAFVEAVNDALDRAQAYVERMVVPHYAQLWRGAGAVAVATLWQDLDALRDTTFLAGSTPGFGARRRAARLVRDIHIDIDWLPAGDVSMRHRTFSGAWQVILTPWMLHRMGYTDSAELDDAVLRVVLQQYASILAVGRFRPPSPRRGWDVAMTEAEQTDRAHVQSRWLRIGGYTLLGGIIATLLYSGYANW